MAKALLVFVMLMAFFLPAFALYDRFDREVRRSRADFAATQVANRFEELILGRLEVLGMFRYLLPSLGLGSYDEFAAWSERIEQDLPGFLAVTFVNPEGYLTWVVPPIGTNKVAIGKFALGKPDVGPYMSQARDQREPRMSHIVPLYQGPRGIVVSYPLFLKGEFKGWINGAFAMDALVGDLLMTREFDDIYFRLEFLGHPGNFYEHGTLPVKPGEVEGRDDFTVINQRLTASVRFPPTGPRLKELDTLRLLILFGVVASSAVISAFAYATMRSRERLKERLEKEHFQSVLLNLLVHDIINPLLIVRFANDAARRVASPEVQGQLHKIQYAVDQLHDVITRVKNMRAAELGKIRLEVGPVDVCDVLDDTMRHFEMRFKEKNLVADFERPAGHPRILVDRVIFQNNVINNVVSNAIKFSERGGKISIRAREEGSDVLFELRDEGVGMSEEIRRGIFLENVDVTKPGTFGERGTGIGMLQVKSYTRLFGGRVTVQSTTKAQNPEHHGTTVLLAVPRA